MFVNEFKKRVKKIGDFVDSGDGANFIFEVISNKIKKEISQVGIGLYLIVIDGIIRKVGGAGGKQGILARLGFYADANKWTNNPGQHNEKANPVIWDLLQKGSKIEIFQVITDKFGKNLPDVYCGEWNGYKIEASIDFTPFENTVREEIIRFNEENNLSEHDLFLDGKNLQQYCDNNGIKEVKNKRNKRIPIGTKRVGDKLISVDPNYVWDRGNLRQIPKGTTWNGKKLISIDPNYVWKGSWKGKLKIISSNRRGRPRKSL